MNKSLRKNAIFNIINQICTILFQFITFPYISRTLQTENYGKVMYCNSIMVYFLLMAALGTSSYAIREGSKIRKNKEELEQFINEIFTINCISSLISYLLYFITIVSIDGLHSNFIVFVVLGLQIILNIFNIDWLNNVFENFLFIAVRNLIIQILSVVLTIMLVKDSSDYIIYALILSISICSSSMYNYIRIKKKYNIHFTKKLHLEMHLKPIFILFFNNLAVSIYVNSDITILGIFHTEYIVGIYSASVKIYSVVKKMFQAIVAVTLPRMSEYAKNITDGNYKILLCEEIKIIITFVFPMLVGLFMISDNIILIVLGTNYLKGVVALRILCVALMFSSIATVLTTSVLLPNKGDKYILLSTGISSILNIILNIILIPYFSLNGAAITTVFAEFIVMALSLYFSREFHIIGMMKSILLKTIVGSISIIVVCHLVNLLEVGLIYNTIFKIILSIILYSFVEILIKNEIIINIVKTFEEKILK